MTSRTTTRSQFDAFDAELAMAAKFKRAGLFTGATDTKKRAQGCREYLLAEGLADQPSGWGQTYRQWFEATYREAL